MKRIELDFIDGRRRGHWASWVLVVIGLVGIAAVANYSFNELQPQEEVLNSYLSRQMRVLKPAVPVSRWKGEELAAMNKLARQVDSDLNLPWQALFAFMDQATNENLGLIAMEPDTNKGQLIVTAEARDFVSMLDFYEAMQGSKLFSDVALQSHVVNQNEPEAPIRFRLRAHWMIRE